MIEESKDWQIFVVIASSILLLLVVMWSFNGQWPGYTPEYNTYAIQAKAWLNGQYYINNYSHLELAYYADKVYVSFPPFPSVVMLSFVLLFDINTPNALINLFFVILGVFYAYKLARNFICSVNNALFLAFFISISSNFLFLMQNGWVWFFAQNLSFTFTMMAFYYATIKKDGNFIIAFLFLAFAIGCRPFQMVYGFVLLFLMFEQVKELKKIVLYMLPGILVGIFYGLYNYLRFGNFFEFGHNYLTEMVNSPHGQFSLQHLIPNIKKLFLIPPISPNGIVNYPEFDGFSVFLINPIMIVLFCLFVFYLLSLYLNRNKGNKDNDFLLLFIIIGAVVLHVILICLHNTMGGWHFGNRYLIDILPAVFLLMCLLDSKISQFRLFYIPFFIYGFALNTIGTTLFYLK